jgi:hypothetical protein
MKFPPSRQKLFLLVSDQLHGTAQIVCLHPLSSNEGWNPVRSGKIDLGMPITKHMHVGWLVVVREYYDAQPVRTVNCYHI